MIIMGIIEIKWLGSKKKQAYKQIKDFLIKGQRIQAITIYKKFYSCSVADAKDAVDWFAITKLGFKEDGHGFPVLPKWSA